MALLVCCVGVLLPAPADAAPAATNWAQWTAPAGGSHDFHGTVTVPANGFPAVSWTSDSRSPVQLPTGASTFLGPSTPPGARYGSSQSNAYLNLRPYADNATSPSTTTFDFAAPTPSAGWTFVLGDIDADQVRIEARDGAGQSVPVTDIDRWQQGAFNYAGDADTPTWQPTTATLVGNPTAADTNGASDWFQPDQPLSSLTFVFTRRAGFPIYQVWFAAQAHDVTGTVAGTTRCPAPDATVRLLAPDGQQLASVHPDPDGRYTFPGYAAQAGYTVAIDPPATPADGCEVFGAAQRTVDLTNGNAVADFTVRDVVPQPIAGTVTDTAGTPVAGVEVTLTPPTGTATTTTTDDTGRYLFDDNPAGAGYQLTVTAPTGYTAQPPTQHTVTVTAGQPVPDQDFVLREQPAITGTITGPAGPLESVPVTLTDTAGTQTHTVTASSGQYRFDRLPPGSYAISLTAPPGYATPQDREGVAVTTEDVTGQDFALTRVGEIAGTVTAGGKPVSGVPVTISSPTNTVHLHTAADGTYTATDLPAATYTITARPPVGYLAAVPASRTAVITTAGELDGGLNFTLQPNPTPTPGTTAPQTTAPGTTAPPEPGESPGSPPTLAATGQPLTVPLIGVAALLTLGGVALRLGRRTRHH